MKHSYFSNYLFAINFSVVKTVVACQKLIHVYAFMFLLYKVTNLTLYHVLVHRNILMYVILAYHLFI